MVHTNTHGNNKCMERLFVAPLLTGHKINGGNRCAFFVYYGHLGLVNLTHSMPAYATLPQEKIMAWNAYSLIRIVS